MKVKYEGNQLTIWLQVPISIPSGRLPVHNAARAALSYEQGNHVADKALCFEDDLGTWCLCFIQILMLQSARPAHIWRLGKQVSNVHRHLVNLGGVVNCLRKLVKISMSMVEITTYAQCHAES